MNIELTLEEENVFQARCVDQPGSPYVGRARNLFEAIGLLIAFGDNLSNYGLEFDNKTGLKLEECYPYIESDPIPDEITNKFTPRSERIFTSANKEAHEMNHDYVGTEHILLGLMLFPERGIAHHVLREMDLTFAKLKEAIKKLVREGEKEPPHKKPLTPNAKRLIEYAIEEARELNHNSIGTEHLLLGLTRIPDGVGYQALLDCGINIDDIRREIMLVLGCEKLEKDRRGTTPSFTKIKVQDYIKVKIGGDTPIEFECPPDKFKEVMDDLKDKAII